MRRTAQGTHPSQPGGQARPGWSSSQPAIMVREGRDGEVGQLSGQEDDNVCLCRGRL